MASISGKTDKTTGSKLFGILILVAALGYVSLLSLPGLFEQYSFWRDEIFTAAFISGGWIELFRDWIGPDVHPPLYFVIAKLWTSTFGISELTLRGLSFLFGIATIAVLWNDWNRNRRPQRLIALLFTISSPTFLYYSQEARSYSLMLFLSSWLVLLVLNQRCSQDIPKKEATRKSLTIYAVCIALSLTHYFGFILSLVVLIFDLWENKISIHRYASPLVACTICLWPTFHIGYLGNLGGDKSDMVSSLTHTFAPFYSTLDAYIYSSLYFINTGIKTLNITIIVALIVTTSWFCLSQKSNNKNSN